MNIIGFLSASILLTLMPGPDILFVITQSILRGKKAGIIFATGLCTGLIVHTAAVSLGLSLLLYKSPIAFIILKFMGAAYLIYLSVQSFLHRNSDTLAMPRHQQAEQKLYKKGILMNILNPKVLLFFIAFFPQFVNPTKTNVSGEVLLLGVLFMLQAWLVFSFVAILSDRLSRRLMQQKYFSLAMHYIESFVYLAIGISLIFVGISY
ncbi:LysE family translocator [Gabonibacter chumensis]|uniref:LysE family translocator n=1 Tax=Gabonibacter chumensis TaxID=2972474 RepID=UPI0025724B85|nr:LysE family translocator [Gabonibacter chumensis]MCR9012598.1 LysE family translocator [Gabonibacter chumensis]